MRKAKVEKVKIETLLEVRKLVKLSEEIYLQNLTYLESKEGLQLECDRPKLLRVHKMTLGPVRLRSEKKLKLLRFQAAQRLRESK